MPFTVLETAMNFLDREVPWYKMLKKRVSRKVVKCIKRMCDEVQFCIWSYREVNEPVKQTTGEDNAVIIAHIFKYMYTQYYASYY